MAKDPADKSTTTMPNVGFVAAHSFPPDVIRARLRAASRSLDRIQAEINAFDPNNIPEVLRPRYVYLSARLREFTNQVSVLSEMLKG